MEISINNNKHHCNTEILYSYITPELKVIGPPRAYNAYRSFLEDEVAKIRVGKEAELRKQENKVYTM